MSSPSPTSTNVMRLGRLELSPFASDPVPLNTVGSPRQQLHSYQNQEEIDPSTHDNEPRRRSLHLMDFDTTIATPRATDLLKFLPTKTPSQPSPRPPSQQTEAASACLASIRANTLLDFRFMREFSLVKNRPIPERNLSKLSANSVYGIRMAQMEMETQSQTLHRRTYATSSATTAKAEDELRTSAATEKQPSNSSTLCRGGVKAFRRRLNVSQANSSDISNNHIQMDTKASLETEDSSFIPTLWKPDNTSDPTTTLYRQRQPLPAESPTPFLQPHAPVSRTVRRPGARPTHKPNDPPLGLIITEGVSEFNRRKCHSTVKVTTQHGFLQEQDIPQLIEETGYDRTELYALWTRFKALCSIAKSPKGIDKDTFRRGIPQLSVEDQFFIDRVFDSLDADGSGILEWQEFIEALSALEKGDVSKRIAFLFRVYDLNGDSTIHRNEIQQFFLASLLVIPTDDLIEVAKHFIDQIFYTMGCKGQESVRVCDVMTYILSHTAADIYSLFGRTMTTKQVTRLQWKEASD